MIDNIYSYLLSIEEVVELIKSLNKEHTRKPEYHVLYFYDTLMFDLYNNEKFYILYNYKGKSNIGIDLSDDNIEYSSNEVISFAKEINDKKYYMQGIMITERYLFDQITLDINYYLNNTDYEMKINGNNDSYKSYTSVYAKPKHLRFYDYKISKQTYVRNSNVPSILMHSFVGIIECLGNEETIRIEELCRKFKTNHMTLTTEFKRIMGLCISDYINLNKMMFAHYLVVNSSMSLKEISYAVKFRNYSYFSSCFKKHIGMSPCEYRKNIKNDMEINKNDT